MKNVIDYVVIAVGVSSIAFAGDAFALDKQSRNEQLNYYSTSSDPITQIRADKNLRKEQRKEQRKEELINQLNLAPEQKSQMQAIRSKYQPQIQSLKQEIRSKREILGNMMKSNESKNSLRSQHQKMMELAQKMRSLHFEVMLEMREVLTLEQREQWAELMQEHKTNNRGKFR